MRLKRFPVYAAIFCAAVCWRATADDANSKEAIQKSLQSQYALTKATADKKDIVTAGAVLVLQKDNLVMGESTASPEFTASYQDGKIKTGTVGAASKLNQKVPLFLRGRVPGASSAPSTGQRTFVAGEKMWVTRIDVRDDSILFDLFTDAYSDVRYSVALTFKFPKGIQLTADQVAKLVSRRRSAAAGGRCAAGADRGSAASSGPTASHDHNRTDHRSGHGGSGAAAAKSGNREESNLLLQRSQRDVCRQQGKRRPVIRTRDADGGRG